MAIGGPVEAAGVALPREHLPGLLVRPSIWRPGDAARWWLWLHRRISKRRVLAIMCDDPCSWGEAGYSFHEKLRDACDKALVPLILCRRRPAPDADFGYDYCSYHVDQVDAENLLAKSKTQSGQVPAILQAYRACCH